MEGERFCPWFAFWGVEVAVARPFVFFAFETRGLAFIAFEVPNSGLRSAKFQLRTAICYELATLVSNRILRVQVFDLPCSTARSHLGRPRPLPFHLLTKV